MFIIDLFILLVRLMVKPNSTSEIDKDWDDLSYPSERVLNEELEFVSEVDSDN